MATNFKPDQQDIGRAAVEIERLRTALRSIACASKDFENRPMTAEQMRKVASEALAATSSDLGRVSLP